MRVIHKNESHIYSLIDTAMNLNILGTRLNVLKDYYILKRDNSKPNETASYQGC